MRTGTNISVVLNGIREEVIRPEKVCEIHTFFVRSLDWIKRADVKPVEAGRPIF